MSRRQPDAVRRTVSLFTGKTDDEDAAARDGSLAENRPRPDFRGAPRVKWTQTDGRLGRWVSMPRGWTIDGFEGRYELRCLGQPLGIFPTAHDAANAADDALRRRGGE